MKRPRLSDPVFFSSGSCLLDLALGGGWGKSRIANLVGDSSTGKTLLAIEACANFIRDGNEASDICYAETEAAFDEQFARTLGLPADLSITSDVHTVEEFYDHLSAFLAAQAKAKRRGSLYIVDSLDALSDAAEMESEFDKGSYGATKAKQLSKMFREKTKEIEAANCTLFIVSQLRDKLGVQFGEKQTRSGGRALNFYASQIVWLYELRKIEKTVMREERPIGVEIRARVKKNKLGMPFRECELPILFGYGTDDEQSMLNWLKKQKVDFDGEAAQAALAKARKDRDYSDIAKINQYLQGLVRSRWEAIENALRPTTQKYG